MLSTHKSKNNQNFHPQQEAAMGVGLSEKVLGRAPIHVEDADGLHRLQKAKPLGLVLRAGVDREEPQGAQKVLPGLPAVCCPRTRPTRS
jgi:hypothetical protein